MNSSASKDSVLAVEVSACWSMRLLVARKFVLRLLPCCFLSFNFLPSSAAQGKEPPAEMVRLKSLYEKKVSEAVTPLKANFMKSLDGLEQRLAAERDIEDALVVRELRTKLALEPATDFNRRVISKPPELVRQLEIYSKHLESRVRPLRQTYLRELVKMEKAMVSKRRLAEALVVRKEIDTVDPPMGNSMIGRAVGRKPKGDVALATEGARATCEKNAQYLIDGKSDNINHHAFGDFPTIFTVSLKEAFALTEIRFLLWNRDDRTYKYILEISRDEVEWVVLADHSKKPSSGWQIQEFPPTDVKAIRIQGLHNSANHEIHIVEVIAK